MPPVPILTPKQVVNALQKLGWTVVRQEGSHVILTKEGSINTISVPNHKEVARGTLRSIINKSGESVEDFLDNV